MAVFLLRSKVSLLSANFETDIFRDFLAFFWMPHFVPALIFERAAAVCFERKVKLACSIALAEDERLYANALGPV